MLSFSASPSLSQDEPTSNVSDPSQKSREFAIASYASEGQERGSQYGGAIVCRGSGESCAHSRG